MITREHTVSVLLWEFIRQLPNTHIWASRIQFKCTVSSDFDSFTTNEFARTNVKHTYTSDYRKHHTVATTEQERECAKETTRHSKSHGKFSHSILFLNQRDMSEPNTHTHTERESQQKNKLGRIFHQTISFTLEDFPHSFPHPAYA